MLAIKTWHLFVQKYCYLLIKQWSTCLLYCEWRNRAQKKLAKTNKRTFEQVEGFFFPLHKTRGYASEKTNKQHPPLLQPNPLHIYITAFLPILAFPSSEWFFGWLFGFFEIKSLASNDQEQFFILP